MILERVESGCPPTAPPSPAGTPPTKSVSSMKKRR
jgi:hypothetical protein